MMYMLLGDIDALYKNLKLFSYLWHMLLHKISSHSQGGGGMRILNQGGGGGVWLKAEKKK